jgi:putative transposase
MTSPRLEFGSTTNQTETREVMMKTMVIGRGPRINEKAREAIQELEESQGRESRFAMIQMLIPLGLREVEKELQAEVSALVGDRYARGGERTRWGRNAGSVYLGDQKVAVDVPRVRHKLLDKEVPLSSYDRLQSPQVVDDIVLRRVINGIAQGKYEKAAIEVPETFGIKKTAICRRFIRASAKRLREFLERDLSAHDIVAVFMDGKTFAENSIVIALGITIGGDKILLGFVETNTENHRVCRDFINSLRERGLRMESEILFVIDGGKGLYKGIKEEMGDKAVVQRCQWHKRENVMKYLSESRKPYFRRKLQAAYEQPTYEKAKSRLMAIRKELSLINESAVGSLDEGLEETLTLHRLGLFEKLGRSFKTTNCLENVNKGLARYTDRVDHWHNSHQRQRWVATAMVEIEPGLNKVQGYKFLGELRRAMGALRATKEVVVA